MSSVKPSRSSLQSFPAERAKPGHALLVIDYGFAPTPLGRCLIAETEGRICYMAFAPEGTDCTRLADLYLRWPGASFKCKPQQADRTTRRIFAKTPPEDVVTKLLVRGTRFQVEVWWALLCVPAGRVQSYADLARCIGRPQASRAVGSAIGANPIAWLIPCHRVIRCDGQLGGYRWGSDAKKACLAYEKKRQGELCSLPIQLAAWEGHQAYSRSAP